MNRPPAISNELTHPRDPWNSGAERRPSDVPRPSTTTRAWRVGRSLGVVVATSLTFCAVATTAAAVPHTARVNLTVGSQSVALDGVRLTYRGTGDYLQTQPLWDRLGPETGCRVSLHGFTATSRWAGVAVRHGGLVAGGCEHTNHVVLDITSISSGFRVVTDRGTITIGRRMPTSARQGGTRHRNHDRIVWQWKLEDVCNRTHALPNRWRMRVALRDGIVRSVAIKVGPAEVLCP